MDRLVSFSSAAPFAPDPPDPALAGREDASLRGARLGDRDPQTSSSREPSRPPTRRLLHDRRSAASLSIGFSDAGAGDKGAAFAAAARFAASRSRATAAACGESSSPSSPASVARAVASIMDVIPPATCALAWADAPPEDATVAAAPARCETDAAAVASAAVRPECAPSPVLTLGRLSPELVSFISADSTFALPTKSCRNSSSIAPASARERDTAREGGGGRRGEESKRRCSPREHTAAP